MRIPRAGIPGHPALAQAILEGALEDGIDLAHAHELVLDHGCMVPLSYLTPEHRLPVIPIIQNCLSAPMPTLRRSHALGESIRRTILRSDLRVAVIGTGGLSHWPGEPRHGEINSDLDRRFLDRFAAGDSAALVGWKDAEVQVGGSGMAEIRNWVTAMATVPGSRFEVLFYEPFKGFATGCALAMNTV